MACSHLRHTDETCITAYHWPTDMTDVTLWASDLWLGTRTEAGGTATLAYKVLFYFILFFPSPWLHGPQVGEHKTGVWNSSDENVLGEIMGGNKVDIGYSVNCYNSTEEYL